MGCFDNVYRRRMQKVNANKCETLGFKRYGRLQYDISLHAEELEGVDKFKYFAGKFIKDGRGKAKEESCHAKEN